MAGKSITALLLLASIQHVSCGPSQGRQGYGLIGYGIDMYKPPCAHACRDTISGSQLSCSTVMSEHDHTLKKRMDHSESMIVTEPECYATDDIYLQTLAYCLSTHCTDIPSWRLERYWATYAVGRAQVQPVPKDTYQLALTKVVDAPTEVLVSGDPLNTTSLVNEDDYLANYNGDDAFERAEISHERYGIVLLVTGGAIPIATSLLRFVPFPSAWRSLFNAYFITPPAFGSKHNVAIFNIFHMPTRGQAFFILYLVTINFVLSFVSLDTATPNAWYSSTYSQWYGYLELRTGVLSFANLPLLILYSGRNNVLLWLTNWSHGTFLLLHRWVAWICTLQAVVHSAMLLKEYIDSGSHATESKLAYWIWGIVATLGLSIMIPCSIYPIRKAMYEVFLLWHNLLAVVVIIGCYYHIICRFQRQWGYETWIYVAIAIWAFERTMRLARLARNGIKRAKVTIIDEDYIRVDIEGVSDSGHAYLYFPTLTWRVWENHPFSVASTVLGAPSSGNPGKGGLESDIEKSGAINVVTDSHSETNSTRTPAKVGLTFLLRMRGGLTGKIRDHATLPVLVESGYGPQEDLSAHPLLLCIAGGVGITACVPYLRAHPGRTKLLWGVRTRGIVEDLAPALANVDKEVFVGKRMNISEVLERELSPSEDVVVVVSGPNGMADEVRVAVAKLGRQGLKVKLVEEAFSW